MSQPLDTDPTIDEVLQLSNRIALLLTDAGIEPSGELTGALLVYAAALSVRARKTPLPRDRFAAMAWSAYGLAEQAGWANVPERSEPTS